MRNFLISSLRRERTPFIMFAAAALLLAACYIMFWAGLGASAASQIFLSGFLSAAWLAMALMLAAAAVCKPARWLYAGLAGCAMLASSAVAPFALALAPIGVALIAAASVGLVANRRSKTRMGFRTTGIASRSTIIAAALITVGIALPSWSFIAAPSVLALWTALGLSFIGTGATLALWDWARGG